jgi:hypothetical protein
MGVYFGCKHCCFNWKVIKTITPLLPLADTFFIIPLLPLADRRGKTSGLAMTGEVTPSDNHACFS